jgi:sugar phosphate isomerase/epimerase
MVLGSPQQRNLAEHISTEQAYEHAAEVLGGLGDSLQRHNVRIALEPLGPQEGNFLNTAAEARQLHAKIGLAQIGLHLDVKAMSTEPEDIPTVIRKNADWLLHFHANDPNRRGPGMGDVDFGPIIAALREVGYDRWISVEVFDYEPGAERLASWSADRSSWPTLRLRNAGDGRLRPDHSTPTGNLLRRRPGSQHLFGGRRRGVPDCRPAVTGAPGRWGPARTRGS